MRRFFSITLAAFCLLGFLPFLNSSANAVSCSTASYITPDKITSSALFAQPFVYATLNEFLDFNNVNIPSACFGVGVNFYNTFMNKVRVASSSSTTNTFTTRLSSCMKGQSVSLWSPASYLNWTRCTIVVSFVPSTGVIVQQFNNVKVAVNTHVPLAYLGVVVSFLSTISTNWGVASCSSSNLTFTMSIPGDRLPLNVAIPCSPPTAIHDLRYFMVVGVWFMVIWFIYHETLRFMDSVTS